MNVVIEPRMAWVAVVMAGCTGAPSTDDITEAADVPVEVYDPVDWVDPFVATGGIGAEISSVSPGASRPFGMTLVGPDTRSRFGQVPFYHCAGYYWEDTQIDGFSHTHAHGMGTVDYGTIAVMPRASWVPAHTRDADRSAPFNHDDEWASPGRYGVVLQDDGTEVDIVATERGAHHRITFTDTAAPVVIFDLAHKISDETVSRGEISVDLAAGAVEGFQRLHGAYSERFGGLQTSFAATLDPAPVGGGTWVDPDTPQEGVWTAEGEVAGAWLVFPAGTQTVDLRLAISYVDREGAWGNLHAELPRRPGPRGPMSSPGCGCEGPTSTRRCSTPPSTTPC